MPEFLTKIEVGAHDLLWGDTPVNLGATLEGSELTITTETQPLMIHRHGNTPYEERIIGRAVQVRAILLQSDFANLSDLLLGVVSTGTSSDPFDLDPRPQATTVEKLELKPIGAVDDSKNWVIWNASPRAESVVQIQIATQQAFEIIFRGLIDESDGAIRLLRRGDPAEVPTKAFFPQP